MIQLDQLPPASCLCLTAASCILLQALMDCGITAGVGDTSWPHLHNQENPWQAQVLSKANNQTVDGARLHISPAAPRRKSLLPRACCVSMAASLSQLLRAQNSCCPECAGFYMIPRSPTEVYYDVSTESVEAQLYNWFYCCNTTSNPNCPTSAPLHPARCRFRAPAAACLHAQANWLPTIPALLTFVLPSVCRLLHSAQCHTLPLAWCCRSAALRRCPWPSACELCAYGFALFCAQTAARRASPSPRRRRGPTS